MEKKSGNVLSAALLISGISIGISYFTMPIVTGIAGFIPSVVLALIVWLFSLSIGLLYAEAALGHPDGANLFTISRNLLGRVWAWMLSGIFIFSMIVYLIAYTYYTSQSTQWLFSYIFPISEMAGVSVSLAALCLFVFLGMAMVCRVNFVLMVGLLVSFILTVFQGHSLVIESFLTKSNWVFIFFSVPTLFSAFGYSSILPPLCTYLGRDPKRIRRAVFIGTFIPLLVYITWQWFVIGATQTANFWVLYEEGSKVTDAIALLQSFPRLTYLVNFVIFFSMTTSLIGCGLSFVEFLGDGLHIPLEKRQGWRRLAICVVVCLCAWVGTLYFKDIVLASVTRIVTPLGEILINGIIPVWMVAIARYYYTMDTPPLLPGGKSLLFALAIALLILIYLEGIMLIRT